MPPDKRAGRLGRRRTGARLDQRGDHGPPGKVPLVRPATRAVLDLQGYADYVRRSLLAVIDPSQPMPAEGPAPILRRADVANVWSAPDRSTSPG